jgi:selenocysteine lyase/cysteine desulfurase
MDTRTLPFLDRRHFLRWSAAAGLTALAGAHRLSAAHSADAETPTPLRLADGSVDWAAVRRSFAPEPGYINLENGYYSMPPDPVLAQVNADNRELNRAASRYKRQVRVDDIGQLYDEVAEFAGCRSDELVLTRNTTESLNIVIQGLQLEPADRCLMTTQDYGSMKTSFRQREKRFGNPVDEISLPLDPKSDQEILDTFAAAVRPETKVMHITHLINITGQVLPVRKLCDFARERGILTIVDGAHSFAHLDFRIDELGCDFFGTSLHKWLCAPLGNGLLYVRREQIPTVWPLMGDDYWPVDDIRKLRRLGTEPEANKRGIRPAMAFHREIGSVTKLAQLRALRSRWMDPVRGVSGIRIHTPSDPDRAAAIGNVGVDGLTPGELATRLLEDYGIYTVAINHPECPGVRVTPHLYNIFGEADQLAAALKELAAA